MSSELAGQCFDGMGPDGNPATFRFAEGRWYSNVCPDCGQQNGGGVETADHPAGTMFGAFDEYGPTNIPCIYCGLGPMNIVYHD